MPGLGSPTPCLSSAPGTHPASGALRGHLRHHGVVGGLAGDGGRPLAARLAGHVRALSATRQSGISGSVSLRPPSIPSPSQNLACPGFPIPTRSGPRGLGANLLWHAKPWGVLGELSRHWVQEGVPPFIVAVGTVMGWVLGVPMSLTESPCPPRSPFGTTFAALSLPRQHRGWHRGWHPLPCPEHPANPTLRILHGITESLRLEISPRLPSPTINPAAPNCVPKRHIH